jgi:hypothetical protein
MDKGQCPLSLNVLHTQGFIMDPDQVVEAPEYDNLREESAILDIFEAMKNPNPKKVINLARRLHGEVTSDIQKRLCRDIARADQPLVYMRACINKIRDCAILVKQFVAEGGHGMLFTGKDGLDVYPITLDTRSNWLTEGAKWDPEQEMIIQHDAANNWMRDNNKGSFYGKVVLFPQFGFSGEPRIIEMACGDTEGMQKYPGTNYYVRKGVDMQVFADLDALDSAGGESSDYAARMRRLIGMRTKK